MLDRKCITEVIFAFAIQAFSLLVIFISFRTDGMKDLLIIGFFLGLLSGGIGITLRKIWEITRSKSPFFGLFLFFLVFGCLLILVSISLSLGAGYFFGMVFTVSTGSMMSTLHNKCRKRKK
jgi:hypothetical protein